MVEEAKDGSALHLKVKDAIIQLINDGEYKPNSQLPTETQGHPRPPIEAVQGDV